MSFLFLYLFFPFLPCFFPFLPFSSLFFPFFFPFSSQLCLQASSASQFCNHLKPNCQQQPAISQQQPAAASSSQQQLAAASSSQQQPAAASNRSVLSSCPRCSALIWSGLVWWPSPSRPTRAAARSPPCSSPAKSLARASWLPPPPEDLPRPDLFRITFP